MCSNDLNMPNSKMLPTSSLNPPRQKLEPQITPNNESELRLNELAKHYQQEAKIKPSIAVRRSYATSQQINN